MFLRNGTEFTTNVQNDFCFSSVFLNCKSLLKKSPKRKFQIKLLNSHNDKPYHQVNEQRNQAWFLTEWVMAHSVNEWRLISKCCRKRVRREQFNLIHQLVSCQTLYCHIWLPRIHPKKSPSEAWSKGTVRKSSPPVLLGPSENAVASNALE